MFEKGFLKICIDAVLACRGRKWRLKGASSNAGDEKVWGIIRGAGLLQHGDLEDRLLPPYMDVQLFR